MKRKRRQPRTTAAKKNPGKKSKPPVESAGAGKKFNAAMVKRQAAFFDTLYGDMVPSELKPQLTDLLKLELLQSLDPMLQKMMSDSAKVASSLRMSEMRVKVRAFNFDAVKPGELRTRPNVYRLHVKSFDDAANLCGAIQLKFPGELLRFAIVLEPPKFEPIVELYAQSLTQKQLEEACTSVPGLVMVKL